MRPITRRLAKTTIRMEASDMKLRGANIPRKTLPVMVKPMEIWMPITEMMEDPVLKS